MAKKDTALVRPEQYARDFNSARPGQIISVDRDGKLMTPSRARKADRLGMAIGGVVGVGIPVVGFLLGGWIGVLVGAAILHVGLKPLNRLTRYNAIANQINALTLAGDREGARAALAKWPTGRSGPAEAARLCMEGSIAYMFGDHATAIDRCQRGLAMVPGPKYVRAREGMYLGCAGAYAEIGEVTLARQHRALVDATYARSEFEKILLISVDLQIAFAAKRSDELPEDETLHDWARLALQFHHSASALVLLAWTFSQRGDEEMADHLLESSVDRSDMRYFAEAYPRLEIWRRERLVSRPLPSED